MLESIIMATIGGALIGLAASILLLTSGRIAGISGIVGGLIKTGTTDRNWRIIFIAGLLMGGVVTLAVSPSAIAEPTNRSLVIVAQSPTKNF